MRVTEGMNYQTLLRDLAFGQDRLQNSQNEVSTGKKVTPPYVKNPDTSVTYAGNNQDMPLQVSRNSTLQTQVAGSDIFSGSVDIFTTMSDLATAMQAGDKTAIDAQVKKLEQFSDTVSVA